MGISLARAWCLSWLTRKAQRLLLTRFDAICA
jgi:hypothetical protein